MTGSSTLDPDNFPESPDRSLGKGHGIDALGPSDISDSGSDVVGGPGFATNLDDDQLLHLDEGTTSDLEASHAGDTAGPDVGDANFSSDSDMGGTGERASAGRDTVVYTSRQLISSSDPAASLAIGRRVSDALIVLIRNLTIAPRYLIAKGGITSSDTATLGLGVRRALVLGQALPGVPVWQLCPEAKFPGLGYVVFPGNVGSDTALAELITRLHRS